jgi:bla regulator protein BlaR1
MTLAWMLYALVVSALLGAAAWALERGLRGLRRPTRWPWAAAIAASLLLPALITSVSIELPAMFAPAGSPAHTLVLRQATSPALSPQAWVGAAMAPLLATAAQAGPRAALASTLPTPASLDALLRRAWAASAACLLLALGASALLLALRKRRWHTRTVAGKRVFVAPDAGPAVVGLLRPRIVLPAWLLDADAGQQTLVIAHEQSHIDARDPQLLTLALCLLVLAPWNLPLWWQLRRLRHAIEVDCDARVINAGHDLQRYGAALIDVGQRQSSFIGAVAAMAESRSLLEQRIGLMVAAPSRWRKAAALALVGASLCTLAVAAQIAPPGAATRTTAASKWPVEHIQVNVTAARLVDYEGVYQVDEFDLVTMVREGRRLWLERTGRERIEMYAERDDAFFSRDVNLQLTFMRNARGRVVSLVLHPPGVEMAAPMLDDAAAARAQATIELQAKRTTPMAGGEAALRRNLAETPAPNMALHGLTPAFEAQARLALPQFARNATNTGAMQSLRFVRVDQYGWDVYLVKFAKLDQEWHLRVNSNGLVSGAYAREVL